MPAGLVDSGGVSRRVTDGFLVSVAEPERRLPRLPAGVSFWLGWHAFHPDTDVYGR
jgi:hypothetical protein